MDAKELRLGNIVRHKYMKDLSYLKVRIIDGYGLHGRVFVIPVHGNSRHDFIIEEIEPILITEEILKKCGFYQMAHRTVMNSWTCDLDWNRKLSIGFVGTPNEMVYLYEVDENEEGLREVTDMVIVHNYDYNGMLFLHQLQNLYFSITNKELEVKL